VLRRHFFEIGKCAKDFEIFSYVGW
jgi:hypothetical protein